MTRPAPTRRGFLASVLALFVVAPAAASVGSSRAPEKPRPTNPPPTQTPPPNWVGDDFTVARAGIYRLTGHAYYNVDQGVMVVIRVNGKARGRPGLMNPHPPIDPDDPDDTTAALAVNRLLWLGADDHVEIVTSPPVWTSFRIHRVGG